MSLEKNKDRHPRYMPLPLCNFGTPRLYSARLQSLKKNPWSDLVYWTLSSNSVKSECVLRVSGWPMLLISYRDISSSLPGDNKLGKLSELGLGGEGNSDYASHRDLLSSTSEQRREGGFWRELGLSREQFFTSTTPLTIPHCISARTKVIKIVIHLYASVGRVWW